MQKELVVFWRLSDGTRCSVLHDPPRGWLLRVARDGEPSLLTEHYSESDLLLTRALQLRAVFERDAA